MNQPVPLVIQAIEALNRGDREGGVALLQRDLREGPPSGIRWRSVSRLAAEIGAIDIALEAARRLALSGELEALLAYLAMLNMYGRSEEALATLSRLDPTVLEQPSVLHFRATLSGELGEFEAARELFLRALAMAPDALQIWFGFAMVKTFTPGDPDLTAMEALVGRAQQSDPDSHARLLFALGKAWDDCGDADRAFGYFEQGAAIRRTQERYNADAEESIYRRTIEHFSMTALAQLKPSGAAAPRSLFVTGLPRSGTTLVERILVAHSAVSDGAEVNLFKPALIPTLNYAMSGAIEYQDRSGSSDPWGDVAAAYGEMINVRFPSAGLVVDKSLGQSLLIGLLLHAMPDARIVWLRRDPQASALSCFRTYFSSIPWSWSLESIARHFRNEDAVFEHWVKLFPDRIHPVNYEDLVSRPKSVIPAILAHFNLAPEPEVQEFHRQTGKVRTASVRQVRSPLSADRIAAAEPYAEHMEPFRRAYYG